MIRADVLVGVGLALLGGVLMYLGLQVSPGFDPQGPTARFFPILLAGMLIALGLLLAARPGMMPASHLLPFGAATRLAGFVAALVLYAATFRYVDFRVGSWLFILATMVILGARKPWELIVVPPALALATYVIFRHGFSVLLPTWI